MRVLLLDLYKVTAHVVHKTNLDKSERAVSRLLVCNGLDNAVVLARQLDFGIQLGRDEVMKIDSIETITHICNVHLESLGK